MLITFGIAINIMAINVNYIWNNSFVLLNIHVSKGIIKTIKLAKAIELAKAIKLAI